MSNKYPIVLKSVALTPASGSAESDGQAGWSSACTGNAGPSRALRDFDVPELQVGLRLHISESWPMFAPSPGGPRLHWHAHSWMWALPEWSFVS